MDCKLFESNLINGYQLQLKMSEENRAAEGEEPKVNKEEEKKSERQIIGAQSVGEELSLDKEESIIPITNEEKGEGEEHSNAQQKVEIQKKEQAPEITKEQKVRLFLKSNRISIAQQQIQELTQYIQSERKQLSLQLYDQWRRIKDDKSRQVIQSNESKKSSKRTKAKLQSAKPEQIKPQSVQKKEEPTLVEEVKKQQTAVEIVDDFLTKYSPESNNQINQQLVSLCNEAVPSRLYITEAIIKKYLQNGEENHSLQSFIVWYEKQEDERVAQLLTIFNQSVYAKQLASHIKKLEQILGLVNSNRSLLNVNFGLGQNKGKSTVKFGMQLLEKSVEGLSVQFQMKMKRKSELKTFLEGQFKKMYNSTEFNIFKICKISMAETEKSLKVIMTSSILQDSGLKDLKKFMETLFIREEKPFLKVNGEVSARNSLRVNDLKFQNKKVVKWMGEGITANLKIEGSSKIAQHFSSPLAEVFPIFKVIRSGEINVKFKGSDNVDKLFQKLGINQISQQTPTLSELADFLIQDYLRTSSLLWVGEFLRKSLIFACNIPNERILCQISAQISHLRTHLTFSGDACHELGDLLLKPSS